jgi:hypothetical protein
MFSPHFLLSCPLPGRDHFPFYQRKISQGQYDCDGIVISNLFPAVRTSCFHAHPRARRFFAGVGFATGDYLLGKPTRANRKKTIKTKVLVSERMVAPEAA